MSHSWAARGPRCIGGRRIHSLRRRCKGGPIGIRGQVASAPGAAGTEATEPSVPTTPAVPEPATPPPAPSHPARRHGLHRLNTACTSAVTACTGADTARSDRSCPARSPPPPSRRRPRRPQPDMTKPIASSGPNFMPGPPGIRPAPYPPPQVHEPASVGFALSAPGGGRKAPGNRGPARLTEGDLPAKAPLFFLSAGSTAVKSRDVARPRATSRPSFRLMPVHDGDGQPTRPITSARWAPVPRTRVAATTAARREPRRALARRAPR